MTETAETIRQRFEGMDKDSLELYFRGYIENVLGWVRPSEGYTDLHNGWGMAERDKSRPKETKPADKARDGLVYELRGLCLVEKSSLGDIFNISGDLVDKLTKYLGEPEDEKYDLLNTGFFATPKPDHTPSIVATLKQIKEYFIASQPAPGEPETQPNYMVFMQTLNQTIDILENIGPEAFKMSDFEASQALVQKLRNDNHSLQAHIDHLEDMMSDEEGFVAAPTTEMRLAGAEAIDCRPSEAGKIWHAMIRVLMPLPITQDGED